MIECVGNVAHFEGEPKELCIELTYLLSGFVDTMVKEFQVSTNDASLAVAECCKIAFMDKIQRKEYLDQLTQDELNKRGI